MASRDALEESEERTRRWRSRVAFWILLLVLGFWVNVLLRDPNFRITRITVTNNHRVATEEITNRVSDVLAKSVWWVFPRANVFFARPGIVHAALADDPRIAETTVERSFFRRELIVTITERTPTLLLDHNGKRFLLDGQEGRVMEILDETTTPDPALLRLRDTTTQHITLGDRAIDPVILDALSVVRVAIERYAPMTEMTIGSPSPDAITFRTAEGWSVYVGTGESAATQRDRLEALLATKLPAPKRKTIEYIDLRFGERVFYK